MLSISAVGVALLLYLACLITDAERDRRFHVKAPTQMMCSFNSAISTRESQEPDEMFTAEEFSELQRAHGHAADVPILAKSQAKRRSSTRELLHAMSVRLDALVHEGILKTWYPMDGSLLGYARLGSYLPWDRDVDVCVVERERGSLQHKFAVDAVAAKTHIHGSHCIKEQGEECWIVDAVNESVAFAFRTTNNGGDFIDNGAGWSSRFIDIKTGYFAELYPGTENCKPLETHRAKFDGVDINVPVNMAKVLAGHYGYNEQLAAIPMDTKSTASTKWRKSSDWSETSRPALDNSWQCTPCSIPEESKCQNGNPEVGIDTFQYVFELDAADGSSYTLARPCRLTWMDAKQSRKTQPQCEASVEPLVSSMATWGIEPSLWTSTHPSEPENVWIRVDALHAISF